MEPWTLALVVLVVRLGLFSQDPSIVVDLRTNNGFKGKKFDVFWDEMEAYFNEVNIYFDLLITNIFI